MGWSQVSTSRRWTLLGVGILMYLIALHSLWWSPLLAEIDRLKAHIQQQEQANRAAQYRVQSFQDMDQELLRVRQDLQTRYLDIAENMNPQKFRLTVMEMAKGSAVRVRAWKPDALVARGSQDPQHQQIVISIKAGFYQGILFLSGLEALPWVQSISSVKVVRMANAGSGPLTTMDIKIQVISPTVLEQVKKLLQT